MSGYTTDAIRNIALVGSGGAGKTSLIEALFLAAGQTKQKGSVVKGTTRSDTTDAEREAQHSLVSSIIPLEHAATHVNLIDTPGVSDFLGRALTVLPAVETVALVVDAEKGPDRTSRRLMDTAADLGLARLVIINRIDAAGVKLDACLGAVQSAFGAECLPVNLPAAGGAKVVDCYFDPQPSATDFSSADAAHTKLIDQVVEVDDALMEVYLEQGEAISAGQLHDPFEQALREQHLVPVCFTSAETDAGIAALLDIITKLLPHPGEGNPPAFLRGEGPAAEPIGVRPDPAAHVVAHTFKVAIDPFMGRLAVFRIHQGTVTKDSQLFIGDGRKPFRVSHLLRLNGKKTEEVGAGVPGDICAVAKIDGIEFDSVLHDSHEEDHLHLKSVELPPPMHGIAIAARSRGDEQKISDGLHKLAAEDPSILIEHHRAQNETVIRALGEAHLRALLDDMSRRFHVEVATSPPKIPYRETIAGAADGHCRHKKQTGGAGQFGEVSLSIKPLPRGSGFRFIDQIVGGAVPRQFIPAVEKGVRQALAEGVIAGYELIDVEVTLVDGKHHPVDSKEVAFVAAGRKAFHDAALNANPVVLEPIVEVDIVAPQRATGDLTGDLSSKRGRINSTGAEPGGMSTISALVPLSELMDYQSQLKSLTGGEGEFSLHFSHYDPVPRKVQAQLASAHEPGIEDA